MPIYEYECKACGHRMEKLQQDDLERLVSAAGFRLAGGGWYETDFKTGSKKNLAADGQAAGSAKSDTSSTSTNKGAAA